MTTVLKRNSKKVVLAESDSSTGRGSESDSPISQILKIHVIRSEGEHSMRFPELLDYIAHILKCEDSSKGKIANQLKNYIHRQTTEAGEMTGYFHRTSTWLFFCTQHQKEMLLSHSHPSYITFEVWENRIRDPIPETHIPHLFIPLFEGETKRKLLYPAIVNTLGKLKAMRLIPNYKQVTNDEGIVSHFRVYFNDEVEMETRKLIFLYITSSYFSKQLEKMAEDGTPYTSESIQGLISCMWLKRPQT